jgi:hypothetical protein
MVWTSTGLCREGGALEDLPRLRRLVRQLVAGVMALHEAGRVHRDLKGANVMVSGDERLRILDFGLVNELERRTALSSTMQIAGTPLYMSPEQAYGQLAGQSSDWYAVGVMLFYAVTGRYPHMGSLFEVIAAKQGREPPLASEIEPRVPAELDALIERLLRVRPDIRATGLDVLAWAEGAGRPVQPLRTVLGGSRGGGALIGREHERGQLAEALTRLMRRIPGRVEVVGEQGAGKSALLAELRAELRARADCVVLEGRCLPQDHVPFKAFDGLIDQLGRYLRRLPRAEVESMLDGADFAALAAVFPALRVVPGVEASQGLESVLVKLGLDSGEEAPEGRRRRAFRALRTILHRLALRVYLVLMIEDLHWGDLDSARLLADVFGPPGAPPLLLVVSYRSGLHRRSSMLREMATLEELCAAQQEVMRVEVGSLGPEQAESLARRLLGEQVAPGLARAIAAASRGIPGQIATLVRLVARGTLTAAQVTAPAGRRLSISGVVRRQIEGLDRDAVRLLAAFAISGQPCAVSAAAKVAGFGGDPGAALHSMEEASLIEWARNEAGGEEVAVTLPDLVMGVVSALGREEVVALHRGWAEVLGAEGDLERLAIHWYGAGEVGRSYAAALEAAEAAMRGGAFDLACSSLQLARKCAPGDTSVLRLLVEALVAAGRAREAGEWKLELARSEKKPAKARRLRREAAELLWIGGDADEALTGLRGLLPALSLSAPEPGRAASARFYSAITSLKARGIVFRERSEMELGSVELERYEVCWALCKVMIMRDFLGGGALAVEAALIALELGVSRWVAQSLALAGATALERGDPIGQEWLKAAGSLSERVGDQTTGGFASLCWGLVRRGRGAWGAALDDLDFGLRRTPVREVWAHVLASGSLLASLEGLGEVSVLRARCRRILEHSRQVGCARLGDLAQVYSAWAALVGGDRAVCRALLAQVANASEWGTAALYAWKVGVEVDLVSGDAEAAWARVLDVWPVMEQAQILDATPRRLVALSVRARAGLALWAGRSACPAHVREVVRGDVMRMEREVAEHVPALVRLLRAGIAMREGDAAEAQVALRGALAGFDATGMVIHASCCRWLLASSQGAAEQCAQIAAMMRLRGVMDPISWWRAIAPGVLAEEGR